jgi:ketosteroid isomerase-like protein
MFHKRTSRTLIALIAIVTPSLCVADKLKDDAQAAASKWDEAYNSGRMEALGQLYTADAVVVTKGTPKTNAGIQEFFTGLKSKGWDEHKTTVNSVLPKDNILIVSGRWEMSGPTDGGAKKKFEGNWVNVMERQGDGWRTVLHTWN